MPIPAFVLVEARTCRACEHFMKNHQANLMSMLGTLQGLETRIVTLGSTADPITEPDLAFLNAILNTIPSFVILERPAPGAPFDRRRIAIYNSDWNGREAVPVSPPLAKPRTAAPVFDWVKEKTGLRPRATAGVAASARAPTAVPAPVASSAGFVYPARNPYYPQTAPGRR